MKKVMINILISLLLIFHTVASVSALDTVSKSPYAGAIVIDAATGNVLFEDNADSRVYPASVVKLMVLLVILEAIDSGHLALTEPIAVTAEAAKMGGSQVYLKEHEVFPVEELLYALIVQSANDAATALAIHYAGSKEAFVDLMNQRARKLGMKDTVFHSVHGLPPSKGQLPDVSTPRDIARLGQELIKRPDALKYTSTKERPFRPEAAQPFVMRSHNHLIGNVEGCDGLKTGYFTAAGFSIAATAQKKGQRAIAVVMGSLDRKVRDAKAREILTKGLMGLVLNAPPGAAEPSPGAVASHVKATPENVDGEKSRPETQSGDVFQIKKSTLKIIGVVAGILVVLVFLLYVLKKRLRKKAYGLKNEGIPYDYY